MRPRSGDLHRVGPAGGDYANATTPRDHNQPDRAALFETLIDRIAEKGA